MPSTGLIFINYRRDDGRSSVQRIDERLRLAFGHDRVFRDTQDLGAGHFSSQIEAALERSVAMTVIVGSRWLELLSVIDEPGEDWVVREIAAGLDNDETTVIPTFMETIEIRDQEQLPPEIRGLLANQAVWIADSRFNDDVKRLIQMIADTTGWTVNRRYDRRVSDFQGYKQQSVAQAAIQGIQGIAELISAAMERLFGLLAAAPEDLREEIAEAMVHVPQGEPDEAIDFLNLDAGNDARFEGIESQAARDTEKQSWALEMIAVNAKAPWPEFAADYRQRKERLIESARAFENYADDPEALWLAANAHLHYSLRYDRAWEIASQLLEFAEDNEHLWYEQLAHDARGEAALRGGDPDLSYREHQAALEAGKKLLEENPNCYQFVFNLAISYGKVSQLSRNVTQQSTSPVTRQLWLARALENNELAIRYRRGLVAANPGDSEAERLLSVSLVDRGILLLEFVGDRRAAAPCFVEAISIRRRWLRERPNDPRWQLNFGVSCRWIGQLRDRQGLAAKAQRWWWCAISHIEPLENSRLPPADYRGHLRWLRQRCRSHD